MIGWFSGTGDRFASACHPSRYVEIEDVLGRLCPHCEEEIGITDRGYILETSVESPIGPMDMEFPYHLECQVFMTLGSVNHQKRRREGLPCNEECEDIGMKTKREAAYAAFMYASELEE